VKISVVKYKYDAWGNHKAYNNNSVEITDVNHIGLFSGLDNKGAFGGFFDANVINLGVKNKYGGASIGFFCITDGFGVNGEEADYKKPGFFSYGFSLNILEIVKLIFNGE
jgi:hypothetical protein